MSRLSNAVTGTVGSNGCTLNSLALLFFFFLNKYFGEFLTGFRTVKVKTGQARKTPQRKTFKRDRQAINPTQLKQ